MSELGELSREISNQIPTPIEPFSKYYFDDKADELISDFIWAQRRSNDWPKIIVAIDSALTLVKFLKDNNFLSLQTRDFHITNIKLDTYWKGIEKALQEKRKQKIEKDDKTGRTI